MARAEHKNYIYSCDLCGCERDEDELVDLYGKPEHAVNGRDHYPRADICPDCLARPIGELLDYFERTRKPSERPRRPQLPDSARATAQSAGDTAADVG